MRSGSETSSRTCSRSPEWAAPDVMDAWLKLGSDRCSPPGQQRIFPVPERNPSDTGVTTICAKVASAPAEPIGGPARAGHHEPSHARTRDRNRDAWLSAVGAMTLAGLLLR